MSSTSASTRGGGVEEPPSVPTPAPTGAGVRERVLGRIAGPTPGPSLICVASLHGNEPAGVLALEKVLPEVERRADELRGEVIGLVGNIGALAARRRFLDRDLNRAWTPDRLDRLRARDEAAATREDTEQLALLRQIDAAISRARGPVVLLDLHTTSGRGGAFSTVADRLVNRRLALALPVPLILGLEEQLDGTLTDWFDSMGHVAIGFESGQHDEAESADRAEAAIWLALVTVGLLGRDSAPEALVGAQRLRNEFAHLPEVLEVRYRHPVTEEDRFSMGEGYENFQDIREGQVLAEDARGPVRAPQTGRILMPLYQEQGEDGFFVVREFSSAWLRLSEYMRRIRLDRIVHWFPGISKSRDRSDALYVNRRVARWYALELLHLLGYRKHREGGRRLIVVRRPPSGG